MLCAVGKEQFVSRFNFQPDLAFAIGVERERFVTTPDGVLTPGANKVLKVLSSRDDHAHFKPELSACQLEDVTDPIRSACDMFVDLREALLQNNRTLNEAFQRCGLSQSFATVGPADMPYDIYPLPRYQRIAREVSARIVRAACRVIGTHIHIGMPDADTALSVYNQVIDSCSELCALSGAPNQQRLSMYRLVGSCEPVRYDTWRDFYLRSLFGKFSKDPRRCWDLIRLSVNGTIEFRMFPATRSIEQVVRWATHCRNLCYVQT